MTAMTVMASVATSGCSPRQYASASITEPPTTTGISGRRIPRGRSARASSQSATATATPTTTRKRTLIVNSVTRATPPRARPTASAAGRLRPAPPASRWATVAVSLPRAGSPGGPGGNLYLEELGFLVPEQVVHLPHIGVREVFQLPFRPVHV